MTTIRIDFFQNSRQINEPRIDAFFDRQDFDFIKRQIKRELESYPKVQGKVHWASFSVLQPDGKYTETEEMFKERIKIS
jgi:hypothetical protein